MVMGQRRPRRRSCSRQSAQFLLSRCAKPARPSTCLPVRSWPPSVQGQIGLEHLGAIVSLRQRPGRSRDVLGFCRPCDAAVCDTEEAKWRAREHRSCSMEMSCRRLRFGGRVSAARIEQDFWRMEIEGGLMCPCDVASSHACMPLCMALKGRAVLRRIAARAAWQEHLRGHACQKLLGSDGLQRRVPSCSHSNRNCGRRQPILPPRSPPQRDRRKHRR